MLREVLRRVLHDELQRIGAAVCLTNGASLKHSLLRIKLPDACKTCLINGASLKRSLLHIKFLGCLQDLPGQRRVLEAFVAAHNSFGRMHDLLAPSHRLMAAI